jgi:threonine dehydrogenase-like Zn-dependent dehydrogenase
MKIMVYEGARKLRVEATEDLPLGADEVRVQTIVSGISHGTEMNVYRGIAPFFRRKQDYGYRLFEPASEAETWKYPIRSCDPGVWYMGYANVGRVVEKGPDAEGIAVGDLVYAHAPHQTQIVKKARDLVVLPKDLAPESGIFFTNLMTTFNGILDTNIRLGDTVVVSGLGVIGQLLIRMARASGAFQVFGIDVFPKRLEAALEGGADRVFNPADGRDIAREIRELTGMRGADAVIEASGSARALKEAIRIAAPDTTVTALGWYQGSCVDLDLSEEFHHNRISLRSSQTGAVNPAIRHQWNDARKAQVVLSLLSSMDLSTLVTHRIPFADVAQAYEMIDKAPADIIQVALTYQEGK